MPERKAIDIALSLAKLLKAFRTRGHYAANIDPLRYIQATGTECRSWQLATGHAGGTKAPDVVQFLKRDGQLELGVFGLQGLFCSLSLTLILFLFFSSCSFSISLSIFLTFLFIICLDINPFEDYYLGGAVRVRNKTSWSVHALVNSLRDSYCGNVGVEYTHIENADEVDKNQSLFGAYLFFLSSPFRWLGWSRKSRMSLDQSSGMASIQRNSWKV